MGNNHLFFNTSLLPAGLYALKIKQGKTVSVEKVVIQYYGGTKNNMVAVEKVVLE